MRHFFALLAVLLLPITAALPLLTPSIGAAADGRQSRVLAVVDFNYIDTSGEERDQRSEHEARLTRFMSALKGDLAAQEKFRLIVPACGPAPCSVARSTQGDVVATAREAGADLLLTGNIHKMSTLVQWANVEAIDVKTGRIVLNKLFTFRGDTDEAWARAEAFIADEIRAIGSSP